ncbi:MAG: flagellar biosynthesis regulator FlaF [Hyphomonadaceae bacterium]|nr:flagellar biosynthesis regulator FlaF [Hyphomonadaceae bacterium]
MQALAVKAYGEVRNRTADNKSLEYALFEQITDGLREAVDLDKTDAAKWADAVNRNLELWTVLTTDLLHPENQLPDAIRKSLLELSVFVRRHSMQVLSGDAQIADLIEINESIMQGLKAT